MYALSARADRPGRNVDENRQEKKGVASATSARAVFVHTPHHLVANVNFPFPSYDNSTIPMGHIVQGYIVHTTAIMSILRDGLIQWGVTASLSVARLGQ